jgi:UDP-N-acetylmuramyl pentapeptide phosphotransferase/UDP-N-acetylglucosamine-1-phosphate transferase
MDWTMVILRLIHIFSAVIWAGYAFVMMLFISPALGPMGAEGGKIMMRISGTKNFKRIIPSVAGLTVLTGVIMYYRLFGPFAPLNTGPGLALTVGGLAGILAFADGLRLGSKQRAMESLAGEIGGGKPSAEQAAKLGALQEAIARSGMTSTILMVIALAGMTLSEYFAF